METIRKIEDLIIKSGKSTNSVLMDCQLSHNALSVWKKGKANPSLEAIVKLANYFDVSVDYLLGTGKEEHNTTIHDYLSEREIKLISDYRLSSTYNKLLAHYNIFAGLIFSRKDRAKKLASKYEREREEKILDKYDKEMKEKNFDTMQEIMLAEQKRELQEIVSNGNE